MALEFDESGWLKKMTAEELAAADADPKTWPIVLDKGTDKNNRDYWLYLSVIPSRYVEFIRLSETGEYKVFTDYGKILKFGYGSEVPPEVKEEMMRKHGCDEQYMDKLKEEIRTEQKAFMQKKEDNRIGDIVAMLKKKQQA